MFVCAAEATKAMARVQGSRLREGGMLSLVPQPWQPIAARIVYTRGGFGCPMIG